MVNHVYKTKKKTKTKVDKQKKRMTTHPKPKHIKNIGKTKQIVVILINVIVNQALQLKENQENFL